MRIYLAGAVSGCTYEEAGTWRKDVAQYYEYEDVTILDPMEDKSFFIDKTITTEPSNGLHTADKAIVSRDKYSVLTSDIVLANLSYGENPLIGTCVEIGWADMKNIPIIAVCPKGSRADHPFIRTLCYCVDTVYLALKVINTYK